MTRMPWNTTGSGVIPCCEGFELSIKYGWAGTDQTDLDTKTEAFGETVGYQCGGSGTYVLWLPGGSGETDDVSKNGFERVDVRVNTARTAGLWTSSYNISCYAGWYEPREGSGPALLEVTYGGRTKSTSISPGSQSDCASTPVATITVYSTPLPDGSNFEIL